LKDGVAEPLRSLKKNI